MDVSVEPKDKLFEVSLDKSINKQKGFYNYNHPPNAVLSIMITYLNILKYFNL